MKLATVRHHPESEARLVAVVDDLAVDVAKLGEAAGVPHPSTMLEYIDLGPAAIAVTTGILQNTELVNRPGVSVPLANVELLAPIPRPRKNMWGIGLNYAEHTAESARALDTANEMPEKAVIFCTVSYTHLTLPTTPYV